MQAIRTRYHGPSNSRGSRISAKCEAKTIYVSYDHALSIDGNHKAACAALIAKMQWDTDHYADVVCGVFDNDHYWVFDDKRLKALKAFVNSYRQCTWSGNPWAKPEFQACVTAIGRSYGFHGAATECPTTDGEAAAVPEMYISR